MWQTLKMPGNESTGGRFAWVLVSSWALCGVAAGCGAKPSSPSSESAPAARPPSQVVQKDWEAEYRSVKQALPPADKTLDDNALRTAKARLLAVIEHAQDAHLRANACLLCASLHDARKEYAAALSFYRQAIALVPQEPSGYALSALTLAKLKRFDQAVKMQQELVRRDPDDLQGWLLLGELNTRAGDSAQAAKAYAAYETRRTGLLEGLTRKKDKGVYALDAEHRAECVHALSAAPDAGTSLALVYALSSDPSAAVRGAIISVMQEQRFLGYLRPLQEWKEKEGDQANIVQIDAAIKAILADPVKTRPEAGDIAQPDAKSAVVDPKGQDAKPLKPAP